jgi:hypothetical protein
LTVLWVRRRIRRDYVSVPGSLTRGEDEGTLDRPDGAKRLSWYRYWLRDLCVLCTAVKVSLDERVDPDCQQWLLDTFPVADDVADKLVDVPRVNDWFQLERESPGAS